MAENLSPWWPLLVATILRTRFYFLRDRVVFSGGQLATGFLFSRNPLLMDPSTILVSNAVRFDPTQRSLHQALGISAERALELIKNVIQPLAKQAVTGHWNRVQSVAELKELVPDLQEFILCLQCFQQVISMEIERGEPRGLMAIIPAKMPQA